jgi:hypothetical protein
MRPHFHRPSAARQAVAAGERADSERLVAEALLGVGHPLARLLARFETAYEQLVWVTVVQAAGLVFFAGELVFGLWLAMAAVVVEVGLGFRFAVLRGARRELCLELIVASEATPRLACVERLCRDLLGRRRRDLLASSIDEMVHSAVRPGALFDVARPLADVRVIRAAAPELGQVASLLRADPAVRGVALVEWLLSSPATPLYGSEVEPLRQELRRARFLLIAPREAAGSPS